MAQEETLANNDPMIMEMRSIATLLQLGYILLEGKLLLSCKHALYHVLQKLFPSTRPNGMLSQTLHFTQIPSHQSMDVVTRLAHEFQFSIQCHDPSYLVGFCKD